MKYALLIEDDFDLAKAITAELRTINLEVTTASDGASGLAKALKGGYSLIVLDLMLPELEGVEVCKRIREQDKLTPILILTARNQESDKVLLLELGADDFITKPFGLPEFRARVKAVLRRASLNAEQGEHQPAFEVGDIRIDPARKKVTRADEPIELTSKEFEYLLLLASSPGRVYSREQLLTRIHGYDAGSYGQSVSSAINRLRAKLERNPGSPEYILTIRGIGYSFADPDEKDS